MNEFSLTEAVVYQHEALRIVVKKTANSAAVTLLKRTVYGSNGIRYQHTGHSNKINQLNNPFFFHLFKNEDLVGVYCLDERPIAGFDGQPVAGFYGRYLSIDAPQQGKGYGRLLKLQAVNYIKSKAKKPLVFYSYIEEQNTRSLRISNREGFTAAAILKTFVFRRYSPKIDSRFARLLAADKPILLAELRSFYATHQLTTFAKIGYQNNYFVLKEGNEILAGVQAIPVCWNFSSMPGASGWMMMHVLPIFSATRRFFNPHQYAFLALEGIYLSKGQEELLPILLESTLAHFGYHSALLQIDTKDPINTLLANSTQMGLLSGFQKNILTHVMVLEVPEAQRLFKRDQPVYVSSFDFT
ncbi:hypothetical protein [Spirosoma koreense]